MGIRVSGATARAGMGAARCHWKAWAIHREIPKKNKRSDDGENLLSMLLVSRIGQGHICDAPVSCFPFPGSRTWPAPSALPSSHSTCDCRCWQRWCARHAVVERGGRGRWSWWSSVSEEKERDATVWSGSTATATSRGLHMAGWAENKPDLT